MNMITIYGKSNCGYTRRVIEALDELRLSFTKKNIADKMYEEELMTLGGKHQVPYMIDGDVAMYEADDIVEYLMKTYSKESVSKPRVHFAGGASGVCAS